MKPRAELTAEVMNAHTGEVVRRSFGPKHKSAIKLTDSQIVLHWLNNLKLVQDVFTRNRIVEAHRFLLFLLHLRKLWQTLSQCVNSPLGKIFESTNQ